MDLLFHYFLGVLSGCCFGIVSVFFAAGGLSHWRLVLRLLRWRGKWHSSFIWILVISAALGAYGIWLHDSLNRSFFALELLGSYLLAVSFSDLRHRRIPDDCSLFFAAVFLLFRLSTWELGDVLSALLGAVIGALLLGLPHILRPSMIGLGDVKLLAVSGLIAGFSGVIFLLIRSMILMLLASIFMLIRKKITIKGDIPMAPFVFFGAII